MNISCLNRSFLYRAIRSICCLLKFTYKSRTSNINNYKYISLAPLSPQKMLLLFYFPFSYIIITSLVIHLLPKQYPKQFCKNFYAASPEAQHISVFCDVHLSHFLASITNIICSINFTLEEKISLSKRKTTATML